MHAHVPSCCSSSLSQCPYLSEVITWRRCVCALLCACPCLHLHVYTSLPQVCICIWMNNILRVYECAICWFIHVFSQGKLEAWTRRFTLLLARLYCHSASLCRVCTRMLQLWFYNVNQLSYHSTTSKSTSSLLVLPVSHCWVMINISRKDLPVLYWLNSPVAHSVLAVFFNLTDFYVLSL